MVNDSALTKGIPGNFEVTGKVWRWEWGLCGTKCVHAFLCVSKNVTREENEGLSGIRDCESSLKVLFTSF